MGWTRAVVLGVALIPHHSALLLVGLLEGSTLVLAVHGTLRRRAHIGKSTR